MTPITQALSLFLVGPLSLSLFLCSGYRLLASLGYRMESFVFRTTTFVVFFFCWNTGLFQQRLTCSKNRLTVQTKYITDGKNFLPDLKKQTTPPSSLGFYIFSWRPLKYLDHRACHLNSTTEWFSHCWHSMKIHFFSFSFLLKLLFVFDLHVCLLYSVRTQMQICFDIHFPLKLIPNKR